MNIFLHHLPSNQSINLIKERISFGLSSLQKKVALVTAIIFSYLAVAFFYYYCISKRKPSEIKKLNLQSDNKKTPNPNEIQKPDVVIQEKIEKKPESDQKEHPERIVRNPNVIQKPDVVIQEKIEKKPESDQKEHQDRKAEKSPLTEDPEKKNEVDNRQVGIESSPDAGLPINQKVKPLISERIEKNRKIARDQQNNEKPRGFVISQDTIPETLTKNNMPLSGSQKKISHREIGIASCQGRRSKMEDTDLAKEVTFTVNKTAYQADAFGIFDGHGGSQASLFVKENLAEYLKKALEENNQNSLTEEGIFKALKTCFQKLDASYENFKDGTTAIVAIILGNRLWVANAGDSRTILVKKDGSATQTSEDAKPDIPRYEEKIKKLGGYVAEGEFFGEKTGTFRVNGSLATARAIGDKYLVGKSGKCCISPDPKITNYSLDDFKEGYLVIACDGLYDVATTNEVGQAIKEMAAKGETEENMAKRLVQTAIVRGSGDNVSTMVIKL
jgi:serine/threonine protein phosphatase PrpC